VTYKLQKKYHRVCPYAHVPTDRFYLATVAGKAIGLIRIDDEVQAVLSYCPHQGAEICRGSVTGTTVKDHVGTFTYGLEGKVIRCPWHGWEFNITTGEGIYPGVEKIATFDTLVREDWVFVRI
jgi:nitrite reductase/ring-hydroxylating ferredoxin subunit